MNEQAIAQAAVTSLQAEVQLAPKPGLVDPESNGAHRDMDVTTFAASIEALTPFFQQYFHAGVVAKTVPDLYRQLRAIGIAAENAMLAATAGVNTHRGANFSFGFLLGALGWLMQQQSLQQIVTADFAPLFPTVAQVTQGVAGDFRDLEKKARWSHGEALYVKHGVTGVRGEALAGYPTIRHVILPYLRKTARRGDMRYLRLMVHLMAQVEDANVLHRGGPKGLRFVQDAAKALLHVPDSHLPHALRQLNAEMITFNLSPGGTADYLSLAYFFDALTSLATTNSQPD